MHVTWFDWNIYFMTLTILSAILKHIEDRQLFSISARFKEHKEMKLQKNFKKLLEK